VSERSKQLRKKGRGDGVKHSSQIRVEKGWKSSRQRSSAEEKNFERRGNKKKRQVKASLWKGRLKD